MPELRIAAGDFITVVGESGSGKSTLLKALYGFDPQKGLVEVDGTFASRVDRREYRKGIMISNQFYTVETAVYAMDIAANEASTTSIVNYSSDSAYGKMYGFAVNDNRIFIADGGDFTANSKAYIYSITGTLQKELTVGVGPNGFYFNN